MDVKLTSHKDKVIEAMNAAVLKALEECGLLGEGYAKKLCPVDTGRLRNSIAHTVREDEQAAYIGTNVEYAPHVELGTVRQRAQPYLKPAVADHAAQYKRIINKAMRGDA